MVKENDGIIAFELWDAEEKSIAKYGEVKKLPLIFQQKVNENFQEKDFRNIFRKDKRGAVRLIVESNSPLFQGTKGVARGCSVYLSLIPYFKKVENAHRQRFDSIVQRFAHNLIKFQTRFKGNFNRLISDNARSRPFLEFKDEVKRRIEGNTDIAAQDVCQISHRAVDLDAQIETLRVISGYADASPDNMIKVDLQKTLFRLTNPFFEEFTRRDIEVDIKIPPVRSGDDKVLVDPGLFNAAIWQIMNLPALTGGVSCFIRTAKLFVLYRAFLADGHRHGLSFH